MKKPVRMKKVAKELIEVWLMDNSSEDKSTFASICDRWIQKRKQDIQQYTLDQQEWIDAIEEAYKKFKELGEEKFIETYGKFEDGIFNIMYEDIQCRRVGKQLPKRRLVVRDEYKPTDS